MEDCVFCRIAKGEIPSYKVFEDKDYFAFLDIKPLNPGHTLLIPKKHYRWTYDVEDFGGYFERAKKISRAIINSLGAFTVYFLTHGFDVEHAHIKIVPRYKDDGHGGGLVEQLAHPLPEDQMKDIAEKLRKELSTKKSS